MWLSKLPSPCARLSTFASPQQCLARLLARPLLAFESCSARTQLRQCHLTSLKNVRSFSSGRPEAPRRQQQRRLRRPVAARASVGYPRATGPVSDSQYFATCHPGLEAVVEAELNSPQIGASDIAIGKAGVSFRGGAAVGYRANLWLRSAIRVLQLVSEQELDTYNDAGVELYDGARKAAVWEQLLRHRQTFSVDARVGAEDPPPALVCTRVKDAICDAIRDAGREKPMPREQGAQADMPLFVTCFSARLSIYRDMSGASLHRRGYRSVMHRASLNEAAAAGILHLAGWPEIVAQDAHATIADPMCGSGTFLIEAALMARNVAPGLFRGDDWPFQGWPDFDGTAWEAAADAASAAERPWMGGAQGSDIHEGALHLAARDAKLARIQGHVRLRHGSAASWQLPTAPSLIVTNPPWGQRLLSGGFEKDEGLAATWAELGLFCKGECNERPVCVLSGEGSQAMTRHLHMRADWKKPLTIGGVDTRLLKYSVLPKLTPAKFAERAAILDARR